MASQKEVMISVAPEHNKEKNYNGAPSVVSALVNHMYDVETKAVAVEKALFRREMKKRWHLTKYKIDKIMDAYKMLELVTEDKNFYYFRPISSYFVKLPIETAIFCANHLSEFDFKLYCWLLNKYQWHPKNLYCFSFREIAREFGYNDSYAPNLNKIEEALRVLEKLGLIKYQHEAKGRMGSHGTYHMLYEVNTVTNVQIEQAEEHKALAEKKKQHLLEVYENTELDIRRSASYTDEEKALFQELVDEGKIQIRSL